MNKQTLKRYLISSLVTFLTGFLLSISPEIQNITMESLRNGAALGIVFIALRAGVKALIEYLILVIKK